MTIVSNNTGKNWSMAFMAKSRCNSITPGGAVPRNRVNLAKIACNIDPAPKAFHHVDNGGTIGPGEVQWMTAASGILHEEFHSKGYTKSGGPFRMVQLWVNLPAKDKSAPAGYQAITRDMIPDVPLDGGRARLIAGSLDGVAGPANTFTPVNLWDVRLDADAEVKLPLPDGHNSMVAVLSGHITIDDEGVGEAEIARLSIEGEGATIKADGDAVILIMTGEPIDEPVFGYGPFVMNTESEIREAIADFNSGGFGTMSA
jgi:redox-sensitive bicupin YhaK (pirin superfamily)